MPAKQSQHRDHTQRTHRMVLSEFLTCQALFVLYAVVFAQVIARVSGPLGVKVATAWALRNNPAAREEKECRAAVFKLQQDLVKINAQDEFARYARTQRSLNEKTAELKRLKLASSTVVSGATSSVGYATKILSYAVLGAVILSCRWTPVARFPTDFFAPFSWLIALPSMPSGTLSGVIWLVICRRVTANAIAAVP